MHFLNGRLAGLVGLVCLLLGIGAPLRASDGPIAGQGGGVLTPAELRDSFAGVQIIDVNPAEPGSTSQGLQEALARCPGSPPGNCILQLRANTTYTIPAKSTWPNPSSDFCAFETNGGDQIWLRGSGDSSVISFTDNNDGVGVSPAGLARLICVEAGTDGFLLSHAKVLKSATCTSGCTSGNGDSAIVLIASSAKNVVVETNDLRSTQAVTSDATTNQSWVIKVEGDYSQSPDTAFLPTNVAIVDNHIQVSASAIQSLHCNLCTFSRNRIDFLGVPNDSDQPSIRGLDLYGGHGTSISNNVIDMSRNGQSNVSFSGAFVMHSDEYDHTITGQNTAVSITNNIIYGLRDPDQFGVWMIGYNGLNVVGNTFKGGMCSANNLRSCSEVADCEDIGGTCDTVLARGIYMAGSGGDDQPVNLNTGNSFVANMFDGFRDTGSSCPFYFEAPAGDPTANTRNLFGFNVMRLNVTSADGFCGDAGRIALNQLHGNYVVGGVVKQPVAVVSRDFTPFVVNGGDEGSATTVVFSHSVLGQTMGPTGALRLTLRGLFVNPTTAGTGLLARIRFGSTTLYEYRAATATIASPGAPITLEFTLVNIDGLTNSQRLGGQIHLGHPNTPAVGQGSNVSGNSLLAYGTVRGTSSIDTLADQTLDVSFSIGGTAADNVLTIDSVTLELL